ncbi:MAG: hypothetical protein ACOYMV_00635 [Verrucomicrobiia bacterium]
MAGRLCHRWDFGSGLAAQEGLALAAPRKQAAEFLRGEDLAPNRDLVEGAVEETAAQLAEANRKRGLLCRVKRRVEYLGLPRVEVENLFQ